MALLVANLAFTSGAKDHCGQRKIKKTDIVFYILNFSINFKIRLVILFRLLF